MDSRQQRAAAAGRCIRLHDFELDLDRRELRAADGSQAVLRPKALQALLLLAEQPGHVVTKDEIMARVWPRTVVTEDSITQLMNEIRRQLGDADRALVRTVARRGYVLAVEGAVTTGLLLRQLPSPAPATNLPLTSASLFGRDSDLSAVCALVRRQRLVTIAGAGGIGKTSLALAVARSLLDSFAHGAWWVDLAMLSDPAQVVHAIAAAAGVELNRGEPRRRLAAELSGRDTLLVLDNCEHLVAEVAELVSVLIASATRVKVLATSQEPLRSAEERLHRLGVLEVPPEGAGLDAAVAFGAFALFVQRLTAANPSVALDERGVALAIDICRHLDGVPLAIEMAAARAAVLGIGAVHALLGDRLRVLRNSRRMVAPRHETLRATLEWSCSLLSENELAALRRLSVFAGPFDPELAGQVIAENPGDDGWTLDVLCSLADKSLVRVEPQEPVRFRLLESTRLLARERLAEAGEAEAVLRRHGRAMAALGPRIAAAFVFDADSDAEVQARFGIYYAELERAFEYACLHDDADMASSILVGLRSLDQLRGDMEAMHGRIVKILRLLPPQTGLAPARIPAVVASCGWLAIDTMSARDAAAAAVQAWRAFGAEPRSLAHALLLLATESARHGACDEAHAALAEARQIVDRLGLPKLRLITSVHSGHVAMFCGDAQAHLQCMKDALTLARKIGASAAACYAQTFLPRAAQMTGDLALAVSLGSQAAHELRARHQRGFLAAVLLDLVRALADSGELERARFEAIEALPLAWEFGYRAEMARHMAWLALRLEDTAAAARLLGYARVGQPEADNALERYAQADWADLQRAAQAALGPLRSGEAIDAGSRLDDESAFALAMSLTGATRT